MCMPGRSDTDGTWTRSETVRADAELGLPERPGGEFQRPLEAPLLDAVLAQRQDVGGEDGPLPDRVGDADEGGGSQVRRDRPAVVRRTVVGASSARAARQEERPKPFSHGGPPAIPGPAVPCGPPGEQIESPSE